MLLSAVWIRLKYNSMIQCDSDVVRFTTLIEVPETFTNWEQDEGPDDPVPGDSEVRTAKFVSIRYIFQDRRRPILHLIEQLLQISVSWIESGRTFHVTEADLMKSLSNILIVTSYLDTSLAEVETQKDVSQRPVNNYNMECQFIKALSFSSYK